LLWPDPQPPYADHTLVDQAVAAVRQAKPALAGFANAVLRRFLRERDALVKQVLRQPEATYNHPAWWIDRLRADWPTQWQALLCQAQQRPPMVLRVNQRRGTVAGYLARLAEAGLTAAAQPAGSSQGEGAATAVVLGQPCPVDRLPGFAQGDVSVQDSAAQRAAPLLLGAGLAPGARVLDACAAPGGKTAHLLECAELDLLALDNDPARLARVRDSLARLGLLPAADGLAAASERPATGASVELRAADARRPDTWWDGRLFDAILLDAPCSASGIVRRHPDIRWLRRPDDIAGLVRVQAALLDALWPLLRPGGRLLYATCSIFKAEGQAQIDAFLQRCSPGEALLDPNSPGHLLPVPENQAAATGARRAPVSPFVDRGLAEAGGAGGVGEAAPPWPEGDGFFYALLHKRAAPATSP
jgi:16S rRNA (cytosine967-C5)-methyltransferase